MNASLDPEGLLRCFADAGLRYVVIGGLAVNAHGVIRATKDLDICPDPGRENVERLAAVLRDLQAAHVGMEDFEAHELQFDPANVDDLLQGGNFRLKTRLGDLDVMQWISGVAGENAYSALAGEVMLVELGELQVPVCSLEHLRAMKHAAGRPQDLQDLADLAIAHGDDGYRR